jgi:hypothetical protein
MAKLRITNPPPDQIPIEKLNDEYTSSFTLIHPTTRDHIRLHVVVDQKNLPMYGFYFDLYVNNIKSGIAFVAIEEGMDSDVGSNVALTKFEIKQEFLSDINLLSALKFMIQENPLVQEYIIDNQAYSFADRSQTRPWG